MGNMDEQNEKIKLNDITIGLKNIGESCYINSTIQCLSNSQKLANFFLSQYQYDKNDNNKKVSNELYKLLKYLWDLSNNNKPFGPYDFKQIIGKENPMFKGLNDGDCKDFYIFLINKLHQELNIIKNNINNDNEDKTNSYNDSNKVNNEKAYKSFEIYYKKNYNSIISELFYGIIEKKVKCKKCNDIQYSYEVFSNLEFLLDQINIYYRKNLDGIMNCDININECFDYYQREELTIGKNKIYCNKCKSKDYSYVSLNLFSIPYYLVIILNRDKGNTYKCQVNFPEILDLSIFLNQKGPKDNLYNLYAVICHFGPDENSGHFFAYCRHRISNKWYLYNDSIVTECEGYNNFKGMPYILFYQKIINS